MYVSPKSDCPHIDNLINVEEFKKIDCKFFLN